MFQYQQGTSDVGHRTKCLVFTLDRQQRLELTTNTFTHRTPHTEYRIQLCSFYCSSLYSTSVQSSIIWGRYLSLLFVLYDFFLVCFLRTKPAQRSAATGRPYQEDAIVYLPHIHRCNMSITNRDFDQSSHGNPNPTLAWYIKPAPSLTYLNQA